MFHLLVFDGSEEPMFFRSNVIKTANTAVLIRSLTVESLRANQQHKTDSANNMIPNRITFNTPTIRLTQGMVSHLYSLAPAVANSERSVQFSPCCTGDLYSTGLPSFEGEGL